ncbi:hypothetical protein [Mesorhizobium sp. L48C026A00]|uniref:hypothetical protein n=1 Tax=Mesorhizobium sp. L48C026A00 TaxID=1287182 RepID=UPI0003CFF0C1|nr:hypothetical protein [Mesorhizobium sp. L48C026A00]ESZ18498.1 hypothetical protein X737_18175 [Mesorhizobium sp. L48C026A00]
MDDAETWFAEIDSRRAAGTGLEFDPAAFAKAVGSAWPNPDLLAFLDQYAAQGILQRLAIHLCPTPTCHQVLDSGMLQAGECPSCGLTFAEEDERPIPVTRYRIVGEPSRDIRWMIVVHGMNTRGAWQEDFSWLIANKLKYSAPVLIHKYGWATVDVLATWLHRRSAKALGEKIRRAVTYATERGLPEAPDILVHSFGSRLFSIVLLDEQFKDLKFGRVITAGSIIRPDFDWTSLIRHRRIEAVLNHVGGKDGAVPFAQFLIPGTGPSGREGYLDPAVLNQLSAEFGHSDVFTEANLRQQLAKGGLWDRFLTQPTGQFTPTAPFRPEQWKPAWILMRGACRLLGWTILAIFGPLSLLRRTLDR